MGVTEITVETLDVDALRKAVGHKYSHGHAFVMSGGAGTTGAARLAARGALRVGAGLVTLGVPPEAHLEVASQVTAIMMRQVAGAANLAEVLMDARITALCIGPGLGTTSLQNELVAAALDAGRKTVLDADALTLMAADRRLFRSLHPMCVLTPHDGEFRRLFAEISAQMETDMATTTLDTKIKTTLAAAQFANCVVLCKGPETVIAHPDGTTLVNLSTQNRAAPWLATAGSGDVLAGFITGLMARGFEPLRAAGHATWLHAECARVFGPGLIAEDLPEALPEVFRALTL